MSEKTDDEIRQIICTRYQHIFKSPYFGVAIPMTEPAMGAPPREWIPKAIYNIDELIETGLSINESCLRVANEIAAHNNIEIKTVEMTYRRHQREHWHEEFCRCVICSNSDLI